jgi:hypothetical protein
VPAGGGLLHELPRRHAELQHEGRQAARALLHGERDARAPVPVERAGHARAVAAVRPSVPARDRGARAARGGRDDGERTEQRADGAERARGRLPDGGGRVRFLRRRLPERDLWPRRARDGALRGGR